VVGFHVISVHSIVLDAILLMINFLKNYKINAQDITIISIINILF